MEKIKRKLVTRTGSTAQKKAGLPKNTTKCASRSIGKKSGTLGERKPRKKSEKYFDVQIPSYLKNRPPLKSKLRRKRIIGRWIIVLAVIGFLIWFTNTEDRLVYEQQVVRIAYAAQTIMAEITMYNPVPEQTDDDPDITASGKRVTSMTAACPIWLEFGQLVEIYGKVWRCDDRMNIRYRNGNYFDLVSFDYEEAVNFGRQKLEVLILKQNG